MRSEPTELKLNTWPKPSAARRPSGTIPFCGAAGVIDEAFADLQDPAPAPVAMGEPTSSTSAGQHQALVATLVTQLETLDRQRQQLAQLLKGIRP